jgi:tryptophan-rich sensory protein
MLSFWKKYKPLILNIALPLGVGIVAGLLTMGAMEDFSALKQPPLSPPGWLFPVVWTILYILMGVSAWRIQKIKPQAPPLAIYRISLVFNFFWPIFFFACRMWLLSLVWLVILWILVLIYTARYIRIDRIAGYLQIPYAVWCAFAIYLNFGILVLN